MQNEFFLILFEILLNICCVNQTGERNRMVDNSLVAVRHDRLGGVLRFGRFVLEQASVGFTVETRGRLGTIACREQDSRHSSGQFGLVSKI